MALYLQGEAAKSSPPGHSAKSMLDSDFLHIELEDDTLRNNIFQICHIWSKL